MHPPFFSTELALKAFEADVAFNAALAQFQKDPPEGTIIAEARRAAGHGFSWFCHPSEPGFFEVRLRHSGGAEISAEGKSIAALLAGLLGHPLAHDVAMLAAVQAADPEQEDGTLSPAARAALAEADAAIDAVEAAAGALLALPTPSPAQAAAESLAAATGGAVVEEEPDEAERLRLAAPLTDEQKAVCVDMIKALTADQRKAFTIAFRHSFRVPREEKAIAPLITEVRHMEFCDRWSIENAGGVAP
jgi:hypothetical protein